jgi:hypothetical protein
MNDHWLVRPDTIRKLWIGFIVVLALTVLADAFVSHDAHFGIDGSFGFAAWYGLLSCVGLILIAKVIGLFLKRPDDYYREDHV